MRRFGLGMVLGGVMALGLANVALAEVLIDDHQAIITGWDDEGDPFAEDKLGADFPVNPPACAGIDVGDDEIGFIFLQSGVEGSDVVPNPGGVAGNLIDVDLNDGEIFLEDLPAAEVGAASVEWVVLVDPPGETLELVAANSNVDGGELVVSAICFAVTDEPDTATLGPRDASGAGIPWPLLVAMAVLVLSVVAMRPARRPRPE